MKLFKKLAAAALAAVLALSMVGCGAGGTGSFFEDQMSRVGCRQGCDPHHCHGCGSG